MTKIQANPLIKIIPVGTAEVATLGQVGHWGRKDVHQGFYIFQPGVKKFRSENINNPYFSS